MADKIADALSAARAALTELLVLADQARLVTPRQATFILVCVVVCIAIPAVWLWLVAHTARPLHIAVAALMPVAALALLLQVPQGYAGAPDDRCKDYAGGKLVFTLVAYHVSRPSIREEGERTAVLLMLVRSPRWGPDPHQCRLPLGDPVADKLIRLFAAEGDGDGDSDGVLTFTFGGEGEEPNVTVRGADPEGKRGPPEAPPRSRRDV